MGEFFYQVHHILERHLRVGAKLSIDDLVKASNEGKGFEVMRGSPLQLVTEEKNGGLIEYFSTHSTLILDPRICNICQVRDN